MEMNTPYPVELRYGRSDQLRPDQRTDQDSRRRKVAVKNHLPQMCAIECRINAEDPYNDFSASPGKITVLHTPGGHGVRVDSHVRRVCDPAVIHDSMIAKLIAVAQTRKGSHRHDEQGLEEYVIEGEDDDSLPPAADEG